MIAYFIFLKKNVESIFGLKKNILSILFLSGCATSGLQKQRSFASDIPLSCKIIENNGESDFQFCKSSSQNEKNRCYAVVEYSNGKKQKIKSQVCIDSLAECWKGGKSTVRPDCVNREDVQ